MAILTMQQYLPNSDRFCHMMYYTKQLLVSAGWTVAGSSNATTGGMDGVDRITTPVTPNLSWVVLQSPHANAADRIQILFQRTATTSYQSSEGSIRYNPSADYASVDTTLPTSAYAVTVLLDYFNETTVPEGTFTGLADNQAPYGFAFITTVFNNGVLPGNAGWALVPLSVVPPNNGKPYVVHAGSTQAGGLPFASSSSISLNSASSGVSRCVAEPPYPPKVPVCTPGLALFMNTTRYVPTGLSVTVENKIQSHPITFMTRSEFIGTSTFMRWNGSVLPELTTLEENGVPLSRIVFGNVNLPWDGVTTPSY